MDHQCHTFCLDDQRGVGAGAGDGLLLSTDGSLRLVNLFEDSAKRMRIPVERADSLVDLRM